MRSRFHSAESVTRFRAHVPTLPAEVDLLVCCAGTRLDEAQAGRLKSAATQVTDWDVLVQKARQHGMMPLLYTHLTRICPEAVPKAVLNRLRNEFHANAGRNLALTTELLSLLNHFETAGISAISFKGPVLAASVYGNLSLRQAGDLDLLVHKQDVMRAKNLLIAQGYQPQERLTNSQESGLLRIDCEYPFTHRENGTSVDLHWEFSARNFSFPLHPECFWGRLEPVTLANTTVSTFSSEDLLLILCVHGAKHHWKRLEWICGVAELVRVRASMDWGRLLEHAYQLGGERLLFLGLSLAVDLLGATLPNDVLQRVRADSSVTQLTRQVQEWLFLEPDQMPSAFAGRLFHWRTRTSLQDKLKYCLAASMTPTIKDYSCFPLPPSLFGCYTFVRLIRLVGEYSRSLWRPNGRSLPRPMRKGAKSAYPMDT